MIVLTGYASEDIFSEYVRRGVRVVEGARLEIA